MNSGAEEKIVEAKPVLVADTKEDNNGKVHIFPIAAGAIAPLVNFPDGCNPEALDDRYQTVSDTKIGETPALKGILRVRFTKVKFEKSGGRGKPEMERSVPRTRGSGRSL